MVGFGSATPAGRECSAVSADWPGLSKSFTENNFERTNMITIFPATITVHCPSGPVNCCEDHAEKVVGLMRFLGVNVAQTTPPDGAQCGNCINENSKEQK